MNPRLKFSFFLLFVGILTLYAVIFQTRPKIIYQTTEVLGESTNLELFVEPEDGRAPLLNYINSSNNILLEVYILSDPEIITAVASRSAKILLEEHPFGGNNLNQKTKSLLGNMVNWSSPSYALTHAKFIVFDDRVVCILNLNITKAAFTKNREYNVCSVEKEDVAEATNIFNADLARKDYLPTDPHLVVSPDNSRGKLTALLNSAQNQIDIEIEVLTDKKMIEIISEKAKNMQVRIIIPEKKTVDNPIIPNTQTRILKSPYPHAKLIIIDNQRAYTGSINFTSQSLDQNRELGILISQPNIIERLRNTFEIDWKNAMVP